LERSDRKEGPEAVYTLAGCSRLFLQSLNMRTFRVMGLVFLASASLAQQQQPLEITPEPEQQKQ